MRMSKVTAISEARSAGLPATEADPVDIDLTNCDREPIHVPGLIQPFGFLVAVSTDWHGGAAGAHRSCAHWRPYV